MSFIFDVVALAIVGYLLGGRISSFMPLQDRRKNDALVAVLLAALFLVVAIPMYLDLVNISWIGPAGSGRNFMWNSGMELIGLGPLFDVSDTYVDFLHPLNVAAVSLFFFYPISAWLGLRVKRRRLVRSNERI